mmetsp:Transcript_5598/g.12252  ORF Transcript_5598/g.12252 Transcript_5598/m.12252 type:complete len:226 (+) Transcript_5598:769-1446(+)
MPLTSMPLPAPPALGWLGASAKASCATAWSPPVSSSLPSSSGSVSEARLVVRAASAPIHVGAAGRALSSALGDGEDAAVAAAYFAWAADFSSIAPSHVPLAMWRCAVRFCRSLITASASSVGSDLSLCCCAAAAGFCMHFAQTFLLFAQGRQSWWYANCTVRCVQPRHFAGCFNALYLPYFRFHSMTSRHFVQTPSASGNCKPHHKRTVQPRKILTHSNARDSIA